MFGNRYEWRDSLITLIEVLNRLIRVHGVSRYLHSDNVLGFVSKALLEWATKESLQIALIDPGKPWQNSTNESFNAKFRDVCLSMEWLSNRIKAKMMIED